MKRSGINRRAPLGANPETTRAWKRRTNRPLPPISATKAARRGDRTDIETAARSAVDYRDRRACTFPHDTHPHVGACTDQYGTELHHIKPRSVCSVAERWDPDNLTLLCPPAHRWCTDNPEAAHTIGLHAWSHDTVSGGRVAEADG